MAWEERNGNCYYYQSERDEEGRVRKRYIGTGDLAETIAHAEETMQRVRRERREWERAELERAQALASPLLEIEEAADILARALLVAAGYRRHKGQWRRGRT